MDPALTSQWCNIQCNNTTKCFNADAVSQPTMGTHIFPNVDHRVVLIYRQLRKSAGFFRPIERLVLGTWSWIKRHRLFGTIFGPARPSVERLGFAAEQFYRPDLVQWASATADREPLVGQLREMAQDLPGMCGRMSEQGFSSITVDLLRQMTDQVALFADVLPPKFQKTLRRLRQTIRRAGPKNWRNSMEAFRKILLWELFVPFGGTFPQEVLEHGAIREITVPLKAWGWLWLNENPLYLVINSGPAPGVSLPFQYRIPP